MNPQQRYYYFILNFTLSNPLLPESVALKKSQLALLSILFQCPQYTVREYLGNYLRQGRYRKLSRPKLRLGRLEGGLPPTRGRYLQYLWLCPPASG